MNAESKNPWYSAGLHFECLKCGRCCSGPSEGYIWVTADEIQFIAEYLKMPADDLRHEFLRRVGPKMTIIEDAKTNDCIFLKKENGQKHCMIYPVRPTQCRDWPFWPENLVSPYGWNIAALKCPGINRGAFHSFDDIEIKKENKPWFTCHSVRLVRRSPLGEDGSEESGKIILPEISKRVVNEVAEIYTSLDDELTKNKESALCSACGKCCDFQSFGHKLFVTTPEMLYFADKIGTQNIRQMKTGKCPYQIDNKCGVYEHRFASCRIFSCKGNPDFQSRLTESAIKNFKSICEKYEVPYRYQELPAALKNLIAGI